MSVINKKSTVSDKGVGTQLQSGYSFWYMRRGKGNKDNSNKDNNTTTKDTSPSESPSKEAKDKYESSIKSIATVSTVEEFWSTYDHLTRPDNLPSTTDYHFFREGIKPTWEDPSNIRGGKWIVRLRKGLASRYWEEIILALIGSQFVTHPLTEGEVCGVVVSIRYSEDIVSVWNRTANDRDITDRLREVIKRVLQLPGFVHMEYKPHETSLADKSSFRNTQVWKPKSLMDRDASGSVQAATAGVGSGGGERVGSRKGSWGERDEIRSTPGTNNTSERPRGGSWGNRDEVRSAGASNSTSERNGSRKAGSTSWNERDDRGKAKRDLDRAWR